MSTPPGRRIRRWFGLLASLMLLAALWAVAGSLLFFQTFRARADRAPAAAAAAEVQRYIAEARGEVYRYLADYVGNTSSALDRVAVVRRELGSIKEHLQGSIAGIDLGEIEADVERYRKVLELMPAEGAARDWAKIQEYAQAALDLGATLDQSASRISEAIRSDTTSRSRSSSVAAAVFAGFSATLLGFSVVTVFLLRRWWLQFHDEILGL